MDGNLSALAWLVLLGHGRNLSEKDKMAMRESGYMDDNDCATTKAENTLVKQDCTGAVA